MREYPRAAAAKCHAWGGSNSEMHSLSSGGLEARPPTFRGWQGHQEAQRLVGLVTTSSPQDGMHASLPAPVPGGLLPAGL